MPPKKRTRDIDVNLKSTGTPPAKKARVSRKGKGKAKADVEELTDLHKLPTSTTQEQSSPLLALPDEIKELIIKPLKFPDLCRLSGVCKELRNFISPLQMLNSIQNVSNDLAILGEEGFRLQKSVYGQYSYTRLARSRPCHVCLQVRPFRHFGTPVNCVVTLKSAKKSHEDRYKTRFPRTYRQNSRSVRPFKERLSRSGLPRFWNISTQCLDCVAQHPRLHECRVGWFVTSDTMVVICKKCNSLKRNRSTDQPPSIRQIREGYCNECWAESHREWVKAQGMVTSRMRKLQHELHFLSRYDNWMKTTREIDSEPERNFELNLPDWSDELPKASSVDDTIYISSESEGEGE